MQGDSVSKQEEVLSEEIRADARRQAERILRHAEREANNILEQADKEAQQQRASIVEDAERRVRQRKENLVATIELELQRLMRDAAEQVIQHVRQTVESRLSQLRKQPDYADVLLELALEAVQQMKGEEFVLVLCEGERAELGPALAERLVHEVERKAGRRIEVLLAEDTLGASGGLVVGRADGREVSDQTFSARMARLWPELRFEVAGILFPERTDGNEP